MSQNTGKMVTLLGEMRRASAITVQELKSLISFAIVVRESLCPANKPKTQNFNLVEQTGTDPCNEDEHRTRWWLFLCKCKIGKQGIIERWTESYGNQEKRQRERELLEELSIMIERKWKLITVSVHMSYIYTNMEAN